MANPVYTYPEGLTNGVDIDFLAINVLQYVPPGTSQGGNAQFRFRTGDQTTRQNSISKGRIFLPIPNNVADTNRVTWKNSELSSIAMDAINTAGDILDVFSPGNGMGGASERVDALGDTIGGTLDKYKQAIKNPMIRDSLEKALIGSGVNVLGANVDIQDLISRETGQVLNPNLELLFKSVQLKSFSYNFTFTPRTQSEGVTVRNIINTFKRRMAAKSTAGGDGGAGLFIQAPDVFELEFKKGSEKHPFLPTHKICALTNIQTNYTGGGSYATYYDGTPVNIGMTLNFTELSPIYTENYDELSGNEGVGF